MKRRLILAASAVLLAAPMAFAAGAPVSAVKTDKGEVLADAQGMTLYTFDMDKKDMSNCYGGCASAWPPFTAKANAKAAAPYSLVKRKDGAMQWAVNGKPLYYWQGDSKKGDATGDGVKGVWHVVSAQPMAGKADSASTSGGSGGSW